MSAKPKKKQADRIRDFNSLSEYKAATAKEGDIDTPIFDGHLIRRIIHNGEAHYSVIDVVGALAEPTNIRRYWSDRKRDLLDVGATARR
jgi:hypothetical protein